MLKRKDPEENVFELVYFVKFKESYRIENSPFYNLLICWYLIFSSDSMSY